MKEQTHADFSVKATVRSEDSGMPLICHWDLTYRCNLSCRHCYVLGSDEERDLKTDAVIGLVDKLYREGCLYLTFSGGEPLVRKDFFDIYSAARSQGFLITLFTNGTLIDEVALRNLEQKPPVMIEITVHSLREEVFDAVTRVRGSFAACMRAIQLLHSRGLPLILKTVGIKENAEEIQRIKDFAFSLTGVQFKFDPLVLPRHDLSRHPCRYRMDPKNIADLEASMNEAHDQWQSFLKEFRCHPSLECMAGIHSFYIDPYGNMRLCPHMVRPAYGLAHGTLKEALSTFVPLARETHFKKSLECQRCPVAAFCSQCPARALLEHNNANEPVEYLCRLAHERAKVFNKYLCPA